MGRLFFIAVLAGGIFYMYQQGTKPPPPPPEPPPRPPILDVQAPAPVITAEELEKVRMSTKDSDPQVRWAAIELLYKVRAPDAYDILENALSIDTELDVRRRALELIKVSDNPAKVKDLVLATKDSEKEIRLAALLALGEHGGPSVAPNVVALLNDVEPDVRLQAIHALGRIQEKRYQEFKAEQDLLREEYEKAVARSQGKTQQRGGMFHKMDESIEQLDSGGKKPKSK